jgi:hypothetical protein
MKTYVLTDETGNTGTGLKLEPGKFVHSAHTRKNMLARLGNGGDTPVLAALMSPVQSASPRLFLIHSWDVAVGASATQTYTVVKEISSIPDVNLEQRLAFALLVLKGIYDNRDFKRWAEHWLFGADRGAEAAATLRKTLEVEHKAGEDLGELAAWGASYGSDGNTVRRMDDLTGRALHAVHAAELATGDPAQQTEAVREIAKTVSHLGELAKAIKLPELAAQALGLDPAELPKPEDQAAAG